MIAGFQGFSQIFSLSFLDDGHKYKPSSDYVGKCEQFIFCSYEIYHLEFYTRNIQHVFQPCLPLNPLCHNHWISRMWSHLLVTTCLSSTHCHRIGEGFVGRRKQKNSPMCARKSFQKSVTLPHWSKATARINQSPWILSTATSRELVDKWHGVCRETRWLCWEPVAVGA